MGVTVVTPPAAEPVSASELKLHLKIDVSTDDALITTLGKAAREYVEAFTRRSLISTTYDLTLDGFPCEAIELPYPPVSSVTSVSYVDTAGNTQTMTAGTSGYLTRLPAGPHAEPATIYRAYGVQWPVTRCQPHAVTVRFVSGYGAAGTDVPSTLLASIKHLVEHWYTNRGVVDAGINAVTSLVPKGVDAMLGAFKVSWV